VSVATSSTSDIIACYGELVEWADNVGLRGDRLKTWRLYETVRRHLERREPRDDDGRARDVLVLELDVWMGALGRLLLPEVLEEVRAIFVASASSALWDELTPGYERRAARARDAHVRSAEAACQAALQRFQRSAALTHLEQGLRALRQLDDARSAADVLPRQERLNERREQLIDAVARVLPAMARAMIAEAAEERFIKEVDLGLLDGLRITRGPSGWGEPWTPAWGPVEIDPMRDERAGPWFELEMQARYEQQLTVAALERAHAEALREDSRRTEQRLEALRAEDEARRADEERERARIAAVKEEERRRLRLARARELAPRRAAERLPAGLTLKHYLTHDRARLVEEAEAEILQELEKNGE
jgi:hypothetical protein